MEDSVIYATISVFSWNLSIKLAEILEFQYRTPILTLVLQKQKTISFFTAMKISLNIQTDNIVQRFVLNFQERRQKRFPTCAKPDNRKRGIEPFYGTTKQLVGAAKHFRREENLSLVQVPSMAKDMDYNNSSWCTKWLTFWIDQTKRFLWLCCGSMWTNKRVKKFKFIFSRRSLGTRNFIRLSMRNIKLEEFIFLFDIMTSLYDKVVTNKPTFNVVWKVIATTLSDFLFLFDSQGIGTVEMIDWISFHNLKHFLVIYHLLLKTIDAVESQLKPFCSFKRGREVFVQQRLQVIIFFFGLGKVFG